MYHVYLLPINTDTDSVLLGVFALGIVTCWDCSSTARVRRLTNCIRVTVASEDHFDAGITVRSAGSAGERAVIAQALQSLAFASL